MKKENIDVLVKIGVLRPKKAEKEKIKSMLVSAKINVKVAKSIPLNDETATVIFREVYESIRQLGEARWMQLNYIPSNHDISLDSLKALNIKEKIKFNYLDRFKNIRHDANYNGFIVKLTQAKEILDLWDKCGKDIIKIISDEL